MTETPPSLATAARWNALDVVFRQAFQFVVTILLARILSPEDFGTFAILQFVSALAIIAIQNGLSLALIQRRDTTLDEESSVFWLSLGASVAVGIAIVAGGGWLAGFYGQADLRTLAILTAVQVVLAVAGDVHASLLTRDFQFRILMRAGAVSIAASGVLALWLAWRGAGIWALAWQGATAAAINSAVLWGSSAWRPRLVLHLAPVRRAFALGGFVAIGMVLDHAFTSAINLFAGKRYGLRELGYFNRGYALQSFAAATMTLIVGRVSLPMLAARQNDPAGLHQAVRTAIGSAMLINVPAFAGLALLAEPAVVLLFGDRWTPAIPYVVPLALSTLWLPMHVVNSQLAIARGQSRVFLRNELIKKSIGIACLAAGGIYGLAGMSWGLVVYGFVSLVVYRGSPYSELGYGVGRQLRDLWPIFLSTLVMVVAVHLVQRLAIQEPLLSLLSAAGVGATTYFLTARAVASPQLNAFLESLRPNANPTGML